jgi:branched-chain amino acid transport system permease protein
LLITPRTLHGHPGTPENESSAAMSVELFVQYLFAGITYGAIYAIVAIGFNIIYNTTGIINFAQGEFVMLGGMISISLLPFMPLYAAIALAVLLTMLFGAFLEICFIRWLESPGVLRMIIITIGLSILTREAALHLWGESIRSLPYFIGDEITTVAILGARISPQVIWVIAVCGLMVLFLSVFFQTTSVGREMKACAANRRAAILCGINTRNMVTLSFMLSAGIGALAGCVMSPITSSGYDIGTGLAIKGFTVAILGGLGNSMAAVGAGLLLGILEAFSISVVPLAFKDAIAITILLLILFVRPHGLFGSSTAARLKAF